MIHANILSEHPATVTKRDAHANRRAAGSPTSTRTSRFFMASTAAAGAAARSITINGSHRSHKRLALTALAFLNLVVLIVMFSFKRLRGHHLAT